MGVMDEPFDPGKARSGCAESRRHAIGTLSSEHRHGGVLPAETARP